MKNDLFSQNSTTSVLQRQKSKWSDHFGKWSDWFNKSIKPFLKMAGSFLLFFAKKNFSSSIFLTLIFLIYYFHFFSYHYTMIPMILLFIYLSLLFLFYLSWGLHPWSRDHVTHTQMIQLLESQEIKFESVT